MAITAVASTTGTVCSNGDVVESVIPVINNAAGLQINPDGGRLLIRRPDGSRYTGVAIMQDVVAGSTMTFVKIPN